MRDKYQDFIYEVIEDKKSALRAREANNMHYLDARVVNWVLEKFEILKKFSIKNICCLKSFRFYKFLKFF